MKHWLFEVLKDWRDVIIILGILITILLIMGPVRPVGKSEMDENAAQTEITSATR